MPGAGCAHLAWVVLWGFECRGGGKKLRFAPDTHADFCQFRCREPFRKRREQAGGKFFPVSRRGAGGLRGWMAQALLRREA